MASLCDGAAAIASWDSKVRLYKRERDGEMTTLATAGSALSLTTSTWVVPQFGGPVSDRSQSWPMRPVADRSPNSNGDTTSSWYTAKVVIDDDPGNSALQRLRLLDGMGLRPVKSWPIDRRDADPTRFGNDSAKITSTAVDDVWSAGYAGLFMGSISSAQEFDDVKIGIDNNADGDADDGGDDVQIDDDFNSNVITLAYDDNGNLTDDGVLKFAYDAWNRLVKAKRRVDAFTVIGTYAYDGANRRVSKVVANCGVEVVANDGGNQTVHFYYDNRWRILETRNGGNQTTRQWVWGTAIYGRNHPDGRQWRAQRLQRLRHRQHRQR